MISNLKIFYVILENFLNKINEIINSFETNRSALLNNKCLALFHQNPDPRIGQMATIFFNTSTDMLNDLETLCDILKIFNNDSNKCKNPDAVSVGRSGSYGAIQRYVKKYQGLTQAIEALPPSVQNSRQNEPFSLPALLRSLPNLIRVR
jgi:hypothetical protein